ncbi:TIGR00341 family protein [Fodinibius sp.]|uniref:TIGR00341 family protein n=1 Tax=Fodinibius sp. TaxID=1872440 RepID=UPI002ACE2680|nr:TIGR00341 family protein [Fodinibius sp.]MDZ7657773.1 TIGR00341 family protein [Fodinibius sp.]
MNYRMLELIAPPETAKEARTFVEEEDVFGVWSDNLEDGCSILRILVDANRTEALTDELAEKFSHVEGFRIMLFEVEATLPQPKEEEDEKDSHEEQDESEGKSIGRISREELYSDVASGSELNTVFVGLVLLSTLVAGVGLVRDDVAVIIGAMVIAPLLGPNVSMALSVTLGDLDLGWQSLKTNVAGIVASLGLAFLMGLVMQVDLESQQLINKTNVNLGDITIALAAGSAGVLAYTRGVPAAIVGVMVAVALLPPLVNVGLLLGAGYTNLAIGSVILTTTNLICINLAGILTFLVQGIQPRSWWEVEKAKKATRIAIGIWVALLAILAIIIWYWNLSVNPL